MSAVAVSRRHEIKGQRCEVKKALSRDQIQEIETRELERRALRSGGKVGRMPNQEFNRRGTVEYLGNLDCRE